MRRIKCEHCKTNEAVWAMQIIPGNDGRPSFTLPGSHYRGFPVLKVCNGCREHFLAQYERDGEITLETK